MTNLRQSQRVYGEKTSSPTPNVHATTARELPAATAPTIRSRKSKEYARIHPAYLDHQPLCWML